MSTDQTDLILNNIEQLVAAGKMVRARHQLKELLLADPKNERIWGLLVKTLTSDNEKIIALEGLLRINPNNLEAASTLQKLTHRDHKSTLEVTPTPPEGSGHTEPFVRDGGLVTTHSQEVKKNSGEGGREAGSSSLAGKTPPSHGLKWKMKILGIGLLGVMALLAAYSLFRGEPFWERNNCLCRETDAYLARFQKRVEEWNTSRTLSLLAASQGDIQEDFSYVKKLYEDEIAEEVPGCLIELHEKFLSLLVNHLEFADTLQKGDKQTAGDYLDLERSIQLELRDTIYMTGLEYRCQP